MAHKGVFHVNIWGFLTVFYSLDSNFSSGWSFLYKSARFIQNIQNYFYI